MGRGAVRGQRPAARRHDPQCADRARGGEPGRLPEVGRNARPQIRLGSGGARALELAKQRERLVTRDDGDARARESLFVRRVTEREEQRDGDRLGPQGANGIDHASHFPIGQRRQCPVRPHPLGNAHHLVARQERRRMTARQIVQRDPILPPQPQQILEPRRGDERDPRAAPFQERVRRDGRAVYEDVDRRPALPQGVDRPKQADGWITRRARDLADGQGPVGSGGDQIGERPADVDADPHTGACVLDRHQCMTSTTANPDVASTTSIPTQSPQRT